MRARPLPRLHLVSDDRVLARPDFVPTAHGLLPRGGAALALHLRGPGTAAAELFTRGRELLEPSRESGSLLVVNDRVDLALVLGLEGVQLGARSLPPSVVRELLGPEALVGVSVHGPDEAVRAENGGADYLVVGTIFPSPSHPGRSGAGPERVAAVSGGTRVPALAIGGITPERVRAVLESGAHGVAVLSGIWDAEDPGAALDRYLGALRDRA